jgi:hypothetical protein
MSARYRLRMTRLVRMQDRGAAGKLLRIQLRRLGLVPIYGRRCRAWAARGGRHG